MLSSRFASFVCTLIHLRLKSCTSVKKVRHDETINLQQLDSADLTGCNSLAALPEEHFIWQVIVVGFGKAMPKEC